jgi:predicted nucleic acid-binding protein
MALSTGVRYLLDTSVLKRLRDPRVRELIESLTQRALVARSTICDLEVGYSARNGAEWEQLSDALQAFTSVETTAGHVRRAIQVQRLLAIRSERGRKIPDLLIAATAEEQGMAVLHYDHDFDLIAAVTGQPVQWVVPAGEIT